MTMRNIYSVGWSRRLGLLLLMVFCSLAGTWAQDVLKPYAVYYDLGDMPSIRKYFASQGAEQRDPSLSGKFTWERAEDPITVPELYFYRNTSTNFTATYNISDLTSSTSLPVVGGDYVRMALGWNRIRQFEFMTPWLNPGRYRVYTHFVWDNSSRKKANTIDSIALNGVTQPYAGSTRYVYGNNGNSVRKSLPQKEVMLSTVTSTRYDFGGFAGYIEVSKPGVQTLKFYLANSGDTEVALDMLQFLPVTETDKDEDYIWPKFDVGGNVYFEGDDQSNLVEVAGSEGSQGKKFYQVKDPSIYTSKAAAKFGLEANKAVTVYRKDKITRFAEFTTNSNGQAVVALPADTFYYAYDDDITWTLNQIVMDGTSQVIGNDGDFSSFTEQTVISSLTDNSVKYGYSDMPFTLSSGIMVFDEVISSNPSVAIYEDGAIKCIGVGSVRITVKSNGDDFYSPVEKTFDITVQKADLTISVDNYDRALYEANPEFVVEYSGFKLGETEDVLLTPVQISCSAIEASTRGDYEIVLSGATATNYNITMINGTLTIGRLEQTITFNQTVEGLVYGGTLDLTATSTSGLPVSFSSSDESVISIEGTTATFTGAGTAVITAFQTGNDDFLPAAEVAKSFTVGKRDLTVTANNEIGLLGVASPAFGYTYSGFVNEDNESDIFIKPEFVTDAVTDGIVTGEAGAYSIYMIPTTGQANNYNLVGVNATFTVITEKMNQNIEFAPLVPAYQDDVKLTAIAYSAGTGVLKVPTNIPITYTSSDPSIIEINGDQMKVHSFGEDITITAIAPASDIYNPDTVEQIVKVSKQIITVTSYNGERQVLTPEPDFTAFTITGNFVNGDTEESVRALLDGYTITTKARFRSKAGNYDIDVNGIAESEYYIFNYVPGVLTVTKANSEIVGFGNDSHSIIYGDKLEFNGTVVSDLTAEGGPGVIQKPYLSSADSTIVNIEEGADYAIGWNVGTTSISAYFPGNDWYEASPLYTATCEVVVSPRSISLVADNKSRYASQSEPEFTYRVEGLSNSYKLDYADSIFTVKPVLYTDATITSLRGDNYNIYFDETVVPIAPNYDIVEMLPAKLTISGGVQQTILFDVASISRIETGNPDEYKFKLEGKATSGLPVTYILANPIAESASLNGNILSFDTNVKVGSVNIIAQQLGNSYYGAAPDVEATFGLVQFEGIITDSSTYEPIQNATVRIYREQVIERTAEEIAEDLLNGTITYPSSGVYDLVDEVKTDIKGFYSSDFVQGASRYKIEVEAGSSYLTTYYFVNYNRISYTWETSSVSGNPRTPIFGGTRNIDIPIPPMPKREGQASVSGKVFVDKEADFVNSADDATVYLLQAVNPKSATPRYTIFYASVIPTLEDASIWKSVGAYEFDKLPWGKYFIGITYPGGNNSNLSAGFEIMVDSSALDTAYLTRDFLISGNNAYTQTITPSKEDIQVTISDVNIFPNPTTNGNFTIATKEGDYTLSILNEAQQVVYTASVSDEQFFVNMSNQPSGLYIAILDFGDKRVAKKITLIK